MIGQKIKDVFSDMAVLKSPQHSEEFSRLSLPSYMRDWLLMKFSDFDGVADFDAIYSYIKTYIPNRDEFEQFKYRLVSGESVRFLARIRVSVDVASGKTLFELPDFGGKKNGACGTIASEVVAEWTNALLGDYENWGVVELSRAVDESGKNRSKGEIRMTDYSPFCPYVVDLETYCENRREFTTEEWIDALLLSIDYNPSGYVSTRQKLYVLQRLLPFVEPRVNLMELAPQGTGKSYIYQKISKRGWLVGGSGTISRAALLYDNKENRGGLITLFDFVAFDEIQSLKFKDPDEIQTALKGYMENGCVDGFGSKTIATAGIVVLGNVAAEQFDVNVNMVKNINPMFRHPEVLDRIHGIIPGWEIPRLRTDLIANDWGLNVEYFGEILHLLRDENHYSAILNEALIIPESSDGRDTTAIKRLCSGLLKLLFPHARSKDDIDPSEFVEYCLNPALEMRKAVKNQMRILKPGEFDTSANRDVPKIEYRY